MTQKSAPFAARCEICRRAERISATDFSYSALAKARLIRIDLRMPMVELLPSLLVQSAGASLAKDYRYDRSKKTSPKNKLEDEKAKKGKPGNILAGVQPKDASSGQNSERREN